MPLYFTHVCTGSECALDPEGEQFPDLTTACARARQGARRLVAERIAGGSDELEITYHIDNSAGEPIARLSISAKVSGLA